ncbi:MAG TPA: nitroreductase [Ktedonobacteraceae bacterium]|nr:nitroreductase [Ktedonobacteraceae bacterium]
MQVFDLIKRRRSIGKMIDERPTREQIEVLLEAATHAPNHHNAQPWKFIVLAGSAREELGAIMASSLAHRLEETRSENAQARLNKERNKPLRSPVIIVVVSEAPKQPKVTEMDNIGAVSASVMNMLLAAEEMGLACMWRTGDAAIDPNVKQWLALDKGDSIIAFLYVGYAAIPRIERVPISFKQKTTWSGWE